MVVGKSVNVMFFPYYRDYLQQSVDAINVFTLRYNQPELESQYAYQYDTIFRFYVLCAFLIFAFMIGVQIILLEWWEPMLF